MKRAFSIRTAVSLCAIVGLALSMPAWAKGKSGGGSPKGCCGSSGTSFNVTSNILGSQTDSYPFQLLSDGTTSYTWTKYSRNDTVISEIQANTCDWELSISPSSTQRAVELNLDYPLSSGESLPPGWSSGWNSFPAIVMTNCARNPANNGVSVGDMTYAGQALQCGLHVTWNASNGTQYSLRMNPTWTGATWAQVECMSAPTGVCSAWTITPIPSGATNNYNGQNTAIGELVLPSSPGSDSGTPLGLYYVSFSISITNP